MGSKERKIILRNNSHEVVLPSGLFGEKLFYDPFSETEDIFSISPNGPLSDMNFGSNGSCYSSPLGSEIGSTETESEDGVSLAELTRRVAEYTFQDDDDDENGDVPQTKDEYSSEYNYPGGAYDYFNKGSMGKLDNPAVQSEIYSVQSQMEKNGRKMKVVEQKEQNIKGKEKKSYGNVKRGKFAQVLAAQGGSGMRAVFLGGSNNGRSGSGGTGVFLPAANYKKEEQKRKPGCSTVLIPARVLHTLQQHFTNVSAQSDSHNTSDVLDRINGLLSQQKAQAEFQTNVPIPPPVLATINHDLEELRLPNEWTY